MSVQNSPAQTSLGGSVSRITVERVLSGRYQPGKRPISWDERRSGTEKISTTDGRELTLFSKGGQSTPAPSWDLLLLRSVVDETGTTAYEWTLYGIPSQGGSEAKSS